MQNPNRLILLAKQMLLEGHPSYCEEVIKLYKDEVPDDFTAQLLLCEAQASNGNFKAARETATNIKNQAPANSEAYEQAQSAVHQIDRIIEDSKKSEQEPGLVSATGSTLVEPESLDAEATEKQGSDSSDDPPENITWSNEEEKFRTVRGITPYFGFSERPYYFRNNNFGFPFASRKSVVDYPYAAKDDEYIIAIFGGSVAAGFYQDVFEYMNTTLSLHPDLKGRRIKTLQFAMGSVKQPQQLFYLGYFASLGQKFDLVINLDGFNDTRNAIFNVEMGHHYSMPWALITEALEAYLTVPTLTPAYLKYYLELLKTDERLRQLESGWMGYLGKLGLEVHYQRKRNYLVSHPPHREGDLSVLQIHRAEKVDFLKMNKLDREILVEEVIGLWSRGLQMMKAMCETIGATYIHAIQPNHYFCSKPLTQQEANWVVRDKKFNRWLQATEAIINNCYPKLVTEARSLDNTSSFYCHMTDVFDDIEEQVFSDFDCHFNKHGHQLIAERLCHFIMNTKLENVKNS